MTPDDTLISAPVSSSPPGVAASADAPAASAAAPMAVPSWLEQDDVLREMWLRGDQPQAIADQLGRSTAAVMTRAVRLGLPRRSAPGRKPGYRRMDGGTGGATTPKARVSGAVSRMAADMDALHDAEHERRVAQQAMRVCLMCLKKFMSQGPHNRICPSCKGSSQYVAASSLPDMSYKVET